MIRLICFVLSIQLSFALELPLSGFIQASIPSEINNKNNKKNDAINSKLPSELNRVVIHILRRIESIPLCESLSIVNQPRPNPSPLMGDNLFHLDTTRLYNGHYHWTNGPESITKVSASDGTSANWLLGNYPGQDHGYIYITSPMNTITPLGVESTGNPWKWLIHDAWQDQPSMLFECVDKGPHLTHYYDVEYFADSTSETVTKAILIPNFPIKQYCQGKTSANQKIFGMKCPNRLPNRIDVLFLRDQELMIPLTSIQSIATMGDISMISYQENWIPAVLVTSEHNQQGFRLLFQQISPLNNQNNLNNEKNNENNQLIQEHFVEINNNQLLSLDQKIRRLTKLEQQHIQQSFLQQLQNIQAGDWLWIWKTPKEYVLNQESQTEELLLQCKTMSKISKYQQTFVFTFYPSNRLEQMQQTTNERLNNFVIIQIQFPSEQTNHSLPIIRSYFTNHTFNNHEAQTFFQITYGLSLGSDLLHYLTNYLIMKETYASISTPACFFYHAAVSLPHPLVYAAEIVCVLLGSKPLVMIQMDSPSDFQWKFPLISELIQSIVMLTHVYEEEHVNNQELNLIIEPNSVDNQSKNTSELSYDIGYHVFTYQTESTLVIYRKQQGKSILEALLPKYQAQALHLLPYESVEGSSQEVYERQVYNAAWNGLLLGYPERFVLYYCEGYHNNLSHEEKLTQFYTAKNELQNYFLENYQLTMIPSIHIGYTYPLDDKWIQQIKQLL